MTAYLTYRTGKGEQDIKWYDRAINEIDRLDGRVKACEERKIKLRIELAEKESINYSLKYKIKALEQRIKDMEKYGK